MADLTPPAVSGDPVTGDVMGRAVRAAAGVLTNAPDGVDVGTAWTDCARQVLAAALPVLLTDLVAAVDPTIERIYEQRGHADDWGIRVIYREQLTQALVEALHDRFAEQVGSGS